MLCGALWGGMIFIRNAQKKPVNVYAITDFALSDGYGNSSQTSGTVTMDHMQKIILTETQTVKEIYVKEGQKVKKGDKLLAYDTTLSDIDLEKAKIELSKLKLQKTTAENDLAKYQKMKPHSSVLVTPSSDVTYTPQETPLLLSGSGTKKDPFYYLWSEDNTLDPAMQEQLLQGNKAYVVLIVRENNALNGQVLNSIGIYLHRTGQVNDSQNNPANELENSAENMLEKPAENIPKNTSEKTLAKDSENTLAKTSEKDSANTLANTSQTDSGIELRFFQPDLPDDLLQYDTEPEPFYQESGSDYTAAELSQMKAEKLQEIQDLEVSIKLADLELRQKEKETTDGTVLSTIDGIIQAVRDPNESFKNGEPVLEVSAGGGYYINGALSELELETVQVGQTVQVDSWTTGTSCEGKIVEISTYPTTDSNSFSSGGNTNVSYYPFRIFVDQSADLTENDFVDVTYQTQIAADGAHSLFLESSFIRMENNGSYVYVRNQDGLLERRSVQTGKDLYGSYTEIRSGLTTEDFIAFPYGNDVTDGAKTQEASSDTLYES